MISLEKLDAQKFYNWQLQFWAPSLYILDKTLMHTYTHTHLQYLPASRHTRHLACYKRVKILIHAFGLADSSYPDSLRIKFPD